MTTTTPASPASSATPARVWDGRDLQALADAFNRDPNAATAKAVQDMATAYHSAGKLSDRAYTTLSAVTARHLAG